MSSPSSRVRATAAAVAVALAPGLAMPRVARADLRDVAARVSDAWRVAGADVKTADARFLNEDETATVLLPAPSASARPAACTTVAIVGARGMSFRARFPASKAEEGDEGRTAGSSVAGATSLSQCGRVVDRVVLTSEAGRGAVEVVVAWSAAPLVPLVTVLPERAGGPTAGTPTDTGVLPPLLPAVKRADAAEARSRRDGALIESRLSWTAGIEGTGSGAIELGTGCHRIELFGTETARLARPQSRRARLDLDAELRTSEDELLVRDRTDAADARLEACVGDDLQAMVNFVGSPPGGQVVVTHASFPLPEHLPRLWGTEALARMALALVVRHAAGPSSEPVLLAQGPSGSTPVPVALEPGACYLATAAIVHGNARGLGMRVVLGADEIADERGVNGVASAVAFCAGDRTSARMLIDARGTALSWGLALFRMQGRVWGGWR